MRLEDKFERILTTMDNGNVLDFHYTSSLSSLINWKDESED